MAPIKFEEQIKDKLEKRTLTPSAESWVKLSERLDVDNKRSRKPIYWWLSIAALLVVMIAITIQVFNKEESMSISPQIVNEEPNEIETTKDVIPVDHEEQLLVDEEDTSKNQEIEEKAIHKPLNSEFKELVNNKTEPRTQLAIHTITEEPDNSDADSEKVENIVTIVNQPEIDKKAVAEVLDNINTDSNIQLDREVDSLLKLASKELTKNNLLKETGKTVDANVLLDEVQDDMGQSFRSKVYEMLKDSYKTVKTAVVQRNN